MAGSLTGLLGYRDLDYMGQCAQTTAQNSHNIERSVSIMPTGLEPLVLDEFEYSIAITLIGCLAFGLGLAIGWLWALVL